MTIKYESYPSRDIIAEYDGATLCDREENYYDDSDGYSHVWTAEDGIGRVGTWTTRCNSGHAGTKVDAYDGPLTEAIRQSHITALMLWLQAERSAKYDADKRESERVDKGRHVTVVKGRKVPKGTEGEVFWMQGSDYHYNRHTRTYDVYRIGIRDDDGNAHWTTDNNVVVTNPDTPHPDDYDTDAEMMALLDSLTLRQLHSMYCSRNSRLMRI